MSVKRHDWLKYKEDYFNSPIDEIKDFFSTYDRLVSIGAYKLNTKGWQEEKQEYKRKIFEGKQKKLAKDPDILDLKQNLIKGKELILKSILQRVQNLNFDLNMSEHKIAIDVIKRELGEALDITKNENNNTNTIELGEDFKYFLQAMKK